MDTRERVERWLQDAVIGLGLCPFASNVWDEGRVRIVVVRSEEPNDAVRAGLEAAHELLDAADGTVATTLVCFERGVDDFETFLDVADDVESTLSEAGAEGVLQIATFHPEYRFDGVADDALGNFTNRAPVPIVHLLRCADVAEAISGHPDPEAIPARNIARLESMGIDAIRRMWSKWAR